MFILSPKSNFLGGSLVSASHLGQLFPGKLYVWKNKSPFLDSNKVPYEVITGDPNQYIYMDTSEIWVNDTCVDSGYYPSSQKDNDELIEFIAGFENIIIVNHQPVNRCVDYLYNMLKKLVWTYLRKVTILNYRAWWNIEWENTLAPIFPTVKVFTSPYHYYLPYADILDDPSFNKVEDNLPETVLIGRSNSKCKVHAFADDIKYWLDLQLKYKVDQIFPDPNISNRDFLLTLSKYKYVLTGYYYGGEGTLELTVPYNKLEWSFMDALLAMAIPVTNELFSRELLRLHMQWVPILDYDYQVHNIRLHNIGNSIKYCIYNDIEERLKARNMLISELEKGNRITAMLLGETL
jgi:hypothetical protein